MSSGREIPTTTVWAGRLSDHHAARSYSMLRPASGDWPVGSLHVVARGWQQVLADCHVPVGPAIEGSPPTCAYVSGRIEIHTVAGPGDGARPPAPGVAYGGLADAYGPIVAIAVEVTRHGDSHVYTHNDIGDAMHGRGAIVLGPFDELKRVRITNVLGKTLEILPPFPHGVAPAGPIGVGV